MKNIFKILIASLIGAILALLLVSCGARKVNREHSKEETKTEFVDNSITEKQSESNVKQTTTINVDDKNETITEETTYTPEDPTKEASIINSEGKKIILNNTKQITKKTTQKNNTKSELVRKTDELKKEAFKEQKSIKQANTSKKENSVKYIKKEAFNPFQLLYLLIPIFIIYWAWRKYKQLPLVPKL